MYEMTTTIPFTEAGADGKLKLRAAVAMMMNCCQFQEYQEKAFCAFLRAHNLAVFLFSIQIDFFRFPSFRETVKTVVKIYGCRSIYGLRRITMRDEAGELCMISNATGAFFDIQAGKAVKLSPDDICLKFDEAEPMECLPRKIPVPAGNGYAAEPYCVMKSGLDPNKHLTSPEFFAIAEDRLPEGFTFNRVRVEFKKQASFGEVVTPWIYETADRMCVCDLRGEDGQTCALMEFSTANL